MLQPRGTSINRLAKELRVPANRLSQIVRGKRGITADTSLRLARCFGFSSEPVQYASSLRPRSHPAPID
ncbi:MAG: HigA family addiction module antitoxin [Acidobacteriota bacterium]